MQSLRRPRKSERPIPEEVDISVRRLFRYLWPYKWRMALVSVALLGSSLLGLVFPLVIQRVLDTVLDMRDTDRLNQLTILLLVVFALQSLLRFVQGYHLAHIGERIYIDIRKQLFGHLTDLSLGFYAERRVGELVSRISSDTMRLRGVLTSNFSTVLTQSVTLTGSLAMMIILNWRLMSFIILLIPMLVGTGTIFGRWLKRISTERQDALADSSVVAEETFQGIRVMKSFTREDYENQRYASTLKAAFFVAIRLIRVRQIFSPLMSFMGFAALAGFLWFGGREVLAGRLTGGELVAFMFYGVNVAGSITSFVGLYASIQEAIGATKRIFEIIDTPPDVADAPDAVILPPTAGLITFEQVSFAYATSNEILHQIDLRIQPGESLALVGPSGAGKTTLANLIPRFYDPTVGRITIDGYDIRQVTQHSLRQQIGMVPQDTLLFGGTVRENILYGCLDASKHDLIEAAKAANAHEFILELPDGYETTVGERGVKLSGGQRQRVAIARAVLKNPRILLLDEATSSLDSASEGLVQEALERLMQGRTTIVIAHRLSTIKSVDRIAVLDRGRIVELGTHEELIEQDGLYAMLYNMQFHEWDSNGREKRTPAMSVSS